MRRANAGAGSLRTQRTTLRRRPERGTHDFEAIARILDEALYCHLGFVTDGQPFVIPTVFGRDGRALYFHGSAAGRATGALAGGVPVCFTATLMDGLVLARSAFRNSMNYRSVMVLGVARRVEGAEKLHGLRVMTEHVIPGRWRQIRPPTPAELKAVTVLRLDIEEASAKARDEPPQDYDEDLDRDVWAGVIPFILTPQAPLPDPRLRPGMQPPEYAAHDGGRHRAPA